MKLSKDIKPISYLKNHTAEILKQVNNTHRPVIITQNGTAKAIIQDPKSFEKIQQALELLKLLAQAEQNVKQKQLTEHKKVFKLLENKLTVKK